MNNIHDSLYGKNKNEAVTNLGDSHQDGHRAGVETKAVSLGDSHQDGHRAGGKTKKKTEGGRDLQVGTRTGGEGRATEERGM